MKESNRMKKLMGIFGLFVAVTYSVSAFAKLPNRTDCYNITGWGTVHTVESCAGSHMVPGDGPVPTREVCDSWVVIQTSYQHFRV